MRKRAANGKQTHSEARYAMDLLGTRRLDMKEHWAVGFSGKPLGIGYQPKRTIYLTFGHDEEISGFRGSLKIMEYLKSKSVQLAAVLDEGGMLTLGSLTDSDTRRFDRHRGKGLPDGQTYS